MGIRAIRVASLLAVALLLPVLVHAQSQFTGQVRDESGGVLPGVLVEASSPALIEKSKSAITDEQGRYTIVDLRPGVYRVTFTLTGFSTIVRPEVELPSNFVATINADMKLGSLAETITVSGQAPMVDVTQASRTDVVTREMLDVLPTTRHVFSVSNMLPGIRFATPDIGGSRQMEQTAPRGHGVNGAQAQEAIDGMSTSSQESNIVWTYVNDSVVQEVTVTTAAHPAEVQAGAMRMNMIPKDGGNVYSGSVFLGGSDGSWQAKNIDDYLRSQNVTSGNGIAHVQTFNASLGGPIKRNRLWFFVTTRHASTDEVVANVGEVIVTPQGEQLRSTIDQYIRDALGRATWQINQKNKFAVFFNRTWKRKGKDYRAWRRSALGVIPGSAHRQVRGWPGEVHEHADRAVAARSGVFLTDQPHHDRQRARHQPAAVCGQWAVEPGVARQRAPRGFSEQHESPMRAVDRLPGVGVERTGSAYHRDRAPHRRVGLIRNGQP